MSLTDWKDIFSIVGTVITVAAAVWAAYVYKANSRLERAKWLAGLYEKFYEKNHLKTVRDKLDCGDDNAWQIEKLIKEEPPAFTDYLNFFEFVAFLEKSKQLKYEEVEQLFSYYLDCLNRRKDVRRYIAQNGYELLNELLNEFTKRKYESK